HARSPYASTPMLCQLPPANKMTAPRRAPPSLGGKRHAAMAEMPPTAPLTLGHMQTSQAHTCARLLTLSVTKRSGSALAYSAVSCVHHRTIRVKDERRFMFRLNVATSA